jgi:hypothetical protein
METIDQSETLYLQSLNVCTGLELCRSAGVVWCRSCRCRNEKRRVKCKICGVPLYGEFDSIDDDTVIDNRNWFSIASLG